jgi:hypothetical protein
MSNLGSLFNKAKAVEEAGQPLIPAAPPATPRTGFKIGGASPSGQSPAATPPKQESESGQAVAAPAPAINKGFKIGGDLQAPPPKQESAPVERDSPPAPTASAPATVAFADETPATKPTREIAADVSAEVARFIGNLDQLHELAPEPDLASSAIRSIMIELKAQPQYIKHVSDDDVRVMIQIMRETMGLAKATKEKKVTARKSKVSADVAAVMAEFDDLDGLG